MEEAGQGHYHKRNRGGRRVRIYKHYDDESVTFCACNSEGSDYETRSANFCSKVREAEGKACKVYLRGRFPSTTKDLLSKIGHYSWHESHRDRTSPQDMFGRRRCTPYILVISSRRCPRCGYHKHRLIYFEHAHILKDRDFYWGDLKSEIETRRRRDEGISGESIIAPERQPNQTPTVTLRR